MVLLLLRARFEALWVGVVTCVKNVALHVHSLHDVGW